MLFACVAALTFSGVAVAAEKAVAAKKPPTASTADSIADRYERARHALELSRANESKARGDRDRLATETQSLQERLVDNAARVQVLEGDFADIEQQQGMLQLKANRLQADFMRDRETVAHLLAVLQRLRTDAPPALALRPQDSLSAARGAMQLGALLPPVYKKAAALARQLRDIATTQTALADKRREGEKAQAALAQARTQLAVLLAQKGREQQAAEAKLSELNDVMRTVGREAENLKSLIGRISSLRTQDRDASATGMVVVKADPKAAELPRGSLLHPVVGSIRPGDPAGPGLTPGVSPEGLWFSAAPGAQAVAPADSEVIFAGPYQKFGQILILEIAGGYDLVLAGLGRIDVHTGDLVLAGEPVGVLPAGTKSSATDEGAALYLELRHGGQAINPAPWMSVEMRKAKKS